MQALPRRAAAAGLALALIAFFSNAEPAKRSARVRAEFQRLQPCPSTGQRAGPCPDYIADHVIPLCAGGRDTVGNLQWQPIISARVKDNQERQLCRSIKNSMLIDKGKQ